MDSPRILLIRTWEATGEPDKQREMDWERERERERERQTDRQRERERQRETERDTVRALMRASGSIFSRRQTVSRAEEGERKRKKQERKYILKSGEPQDR
jgi:hypothetical protein